ncbi:hypothetical protein SLEP1_g42807 [Rubroshorea leprosula]|uniref:Aminotransferase-like plant mobile domain-containing protein n=1 Tax=Rubroshorea leprosula TaxID=152421 RepID=A0AAV5LBP2_9ROSI|nr:hypothetical protein SLEP1_g42807 [Rubroshorea leprosula]
MVDPYSIDGVHSCHDPWYTFWDGFLEFSTWSEKRALEKQKDLGLLDALKEGDISATWFPSSSDLMRARLERLDLLLVLIYFAFPSSKMEDWIGWAKEMLAEHGFVEILRAVGILKWCTSTDTFILTFGEVTVTLKDMTNLMLLPVVREEDLRHITLTPDERVAQVALRKMRYFRIGKGKDTPYVCAAFLTAWLSKFVFGGFLNHEITAECIPLAICLAKGVRFPLAPLMLRKRKVKGQIVLEVDDLLDDYDSFNFHAYKVMPRTFAPLEVSFFDKTLPVVLGSQIVDFTTRNSSHLEMLAVDIPSAPSSDKIDWNKALRPYIDEAAITMWSEGVATLREDNGQWVPVYPPILGMTEEKYGHVGVAIGEFG